MNIAKYVVIMGVLGASFCYGVAKNLHPYQLMAKRQIENMVSELHLTKEELSQAQSIYSAQKKGSAWKALNAKLGKASRTIKRNKIRTFDGVIELLENDRSLRLALVDVFRMSLAAYKTALSNKSKNMDSCDRVYLAVIAFYVSDIIEKFGANIVAVLELEQKNNARLAEAR